MSVDITCISDLHGFVPELPGGDLLIIAGDLTSRDEPEQHIEFCEWLDVQPYEMKVVIAGNHDNNIDPDGIESLRGCYYLEDSRATYKDLKIWGSPWSLTFPGMNEKCKAFTCDTEEDIAEKWEMIPEDIDILITHSPPYGILDQNTEGKYCGSLSLIEAIKRTNAHLIIFGHIHECGSRIERLYERQRFNANVVLRRTFVNASIMNEHYRHVNKPVRIQL